MSTFNKFNDFSNQLALGAHNLNGDTLRVYLTNGTPNAATQTVKADLAGITPGFGYTPADIQNTVTTLTGTTSVHAVTTSFTATGGSIGPFRYAVIYNDTNADDALIGYIDYGSALTVTEGNTLNIVFNDPLIVISFT